MIAIEPYNSASRKLIGSDLETIVDPYGGGLQIDSYGNVYLEGSLDGDIPNMVQFLASCDTRVTVFFVEQLSAGPKDPFTPRDATRYVEPGQAWGQLFHKAAPPSSPPPPDYAAWIEIGYMDGEQFWVEVEAPPGSKDPSVLQAEPRHIILLHMLSHAYDLAVAPDADTANSLDLSNTEKSALDRENQYRNLHQLVRRLSQTVSPKPTSPPTTTSPPEKKPSYNLGGCGCFIATAAYGSPFEPEVASLRHFRDDVLLRTRTGAAFFERFYRQYYRFSPGIAAAIEREVELREAARWAATPVVRYLEIAQMLPDAPLEGVPEPWRSFLTDMRDKLEAWGTTLGLPDDFRGLSPVAAAAELAMALRYILRSEESRQRYLERLAGLGQIPITCGAHEYEACVRALTAAGRPEHELSRLLAIAREEAVP